LYLRECHAGGRFPHRPREPFALPAGLSEGGGAVGREAGGAALVDHTLLRAGRSESEEVAAAIARGVVEGHRFRRRLPYPAHLRNGRGRDRRAGRREAA